MNNLTTSEIRQLDRINMNTKAMDFGGKFDQLITEVNKTVESGSPVNAVAASKVLTLTGVVIDSETVTIGADKYEFMSDTEQTKTDEDNISVDITHHTSKAARVLTIDTQPTVGDTMTIGTKVYTFVADADANVDGEISVGLSLNDAQLNIIDAINGDDEVNTAHPLVTCGDFLANEAIITAKIGGTAANSIATIETFTANTNIFAGVTLTGGTGCAASDAIAELVAAATVLGTAPVVVEDGAGDTVVITAEVPGVAGNAIVVGETLSNGSFAGGATTLSGGVNGTVGLQGDAKIDSSYLYMCIADNTIVDGNWRRISLGSVY
jgi:hypothetical protein